MGIPRIDTGPMTISEFYAFTETRPDEEKWELIEGEPVMNASPSKNVGAVLDLPVVGVTLPLAEIYRDTGLTKL